MGFPDQQKSWPVPLSDHGISHPLVPKGDLHGTPKKTTFPFCDEYYTIYLYTKNNHIQAKNTKIKFTLSKWRPKKLIFVSHHFDFEKKKKTFPQEVSNKEIINTLTLLK